MEKLKISYDLLNRALVSLKKAFLTVEKVKKLNDGDIIEAAQDSCIQRFEYSFDSFWKFLKKYITLKYNVENINSPAATFRAGTKLNLYSSDDGDILLAMVTDRNETTHNYSAEDVRRIYPHICQYYETMTKIIASIDISS